MPEHDDQGPRELASAIRAGAGRRPEQAFFNCLEHTSRSCPVEGCTKHLLLSGMIVHLNDHHAWSREQIANWLDPPDLEPAP